MSAFDKKIVEEFNIPVPWGHIAVKTWGSKEDPHILMIHGTADNAGTFDNLIPHLLPNYYYICMDLPGHGKSSHFPPYLPIHPTDYLIPIKYIVDHFNKGKYILIGHSLGGQIGFLFAQLYPEHIQKFISIDAVPLFFSVDPKDFGSYIRRQTDANIKIIEKMVSGKRPEYEYEDILEKFSKNRYEGEVLKKEAAEPMLKRCLEPTGNGKYTVTTDQRMKAVIDPLSDDRYKIATIKITCPVLIIFAKHNFYPRKRYPLLIKTFRSKKNVTINYVDGKHDVHNNNPAVVAVYVNRFLINQKSKI